MCTYYSSPVAAAKVTVSVGSLARAVCASLVTTEAGAANIADLDLRDCRGADGNSGAEGEDSGELHFEMWGFALLLNAVGVTGDSG